jgi:hypothetical protein
MEHCFFFWIGVELGDTCEGQRKGHSEQSKWMNQTDPKHQHAGHQHQSPLQPHLAVSTMHHAGHRRPSPHRAASTPSLEDKTNDAKFPCHEDSLVELYGGRKLQVKGTNHTWKCIGSMSRMLHDPSSRLECQVTVLHTVPRSITDWSCCRLDHVRLPS